MDQSGSDYTGISIHALRGEGDNLRYSSAISAKTISIHALRGEGDDALDLNVRRAADISIHALRGEGDDVLVPILVKAAISIHALRGEGDPAAFAAATTRFLFQSTPSVGRATRG